jgi:hypothetical protein
MARQEQTCWRCGTQWMSEDRPRATLRMIEGGSVGSVPAVAAAKR